MCDVLDLDKMILRQTKEIEDRPQAGYKTCYILFHGPFGTALYRMNTSQYAFQH